MASETRLNGWRRIGVVLVIFWFVIIAGITITELSTSEVIAFTYQTIPKGTKVEGNIVTLPNGETIEIYVPRDLLTGEKAKPWEIDWSKYPQITKVQYINWSLLAGALLAIPFAAWIILEALAYAIRWIRQGFK